MMRFVVVALVACSTPYQSKGWLRGGYEETPTGARQWLVRVEVNGYTSSGKAVQYAHRRAGELCPGGYDTRDTAVAEHAEGKPEVTLAVACK